MDADGRFDDIAVELAPAGATAGAMFGKRALKAHGKAFACLQGDALAVKLGHGRADHDAALALSGAALFDPSGGGRPFKDWVAVPVAHADRWLALAATALERLS